MTPNDMLSNGIRNDFMKTLKIIAVLACALVLGVAAYTHWIIRMIDAWKLP